MNDIRNNSNSPDSSEHSDHEMPDCLKPPDSLRSDFTSVNIANNILVDHKALKRKATKLTVDIIKKLPQDLMMHSTAFVFIQQSSDIKSYAIFIRYRYDKPWYMVIRVGHIKRTDTLFGEKCIRLGVYYTQENNNINTFFDVINDLIQKVILPYDVEHLSCGINALAWFADLLSREETSGSDFVYTVNTAEFFEDDLGLNISVGIAGTASDCKIAARFLASHDSRVQYKCVKENISKALKGNGSAGCFLIAFVNDQRINTASVSAEAIILGAACIVPWGTFGQKGKVYHHLMSIAVLPQSRRASIGASLLNATRRLVTTYTEAWIPCLSENQGNQEDYEDTVKFFANTGCKTRKIQQEKSPYPSFFCNMIRALIV